MKDQEITTYKHPDNDEGDTLTFEKDGRTVTVESTKIVFLKNGAVCVDVGGSNPYSENVDVYGEPMKIAGLLKDEAVFCRYVEMKVSSRNKKFWAEVASEAQKNNPAWNLSRLKKLSLIA